MLRLYGQEGTPDPAFGVNGKLVTTMFTDTDEAKGIAVQSDGKIVVGAESDDSKAYVLRYNSDGSLDSAFGTGGIATASLSGNDILVNVTGVAILTDGKIVVGGYSTNSSNGFESFFVMRFSSSGNLDSTFSSDGIALKSVGATAAALTMALRDDGAKIVVAGYVFSGSPSNKNFATVLFNSDGTLDTGFDSDGLRVNAVTSGTNSHDEIYAVDFQNDGRIILAGYQTIFDLSANPYPQSVVVRLNTDGTTDATFNANAGKYTSSFGMTHNNHANAVTVLSDNKIVFAGDVLNSGTTDFYVTELNSDGTVNSSFGTGGTTSFSVSSGDDAAYALAVQSDNKIIAAGKTFNNSYDDVLLIRLSSTGSVDNTFDSDGIATAAIGLTDDVCTSVAVNGTNILAAGKADFGGDTNLGLIQHTTAGLVDTSFGISGFVVTHLIETRSDENCYGVTINGDIMLSGYAQNGTNNVLTLLELFSNGELMTNFSGDGKEIPTFIHPSKAFAVTTDSLDPGNIVVVGESNGDFAVARYNYINPTDPDDESFSGDGLTTTDFGSNDESAKAVVTMSSGEILVAGNSNGDIAIAKFHSDGTLDTSFDSDGKMTFDVSFVGHTEEVNGMALQPDGKILITGAVFNGTKNDIFVARFTSSGTYDGSTTIPVGTGDAVSKGIVVQSNGKIILGGYAVNEAANKDIVLVRLNDIGDVDETFGTNGFVVTTLGNDGDDICNALTLDASDNIIIAGSTESGNPSTKDFAVVRYTGDGTVEGTAIVSIGRSDEEANALFIQPDGKIVAVGYSFNGSKNDVAVIRLEDVTPLPVELTDFIAMAAEHNVELQWTTATEVNNFGFEIEKKWMKDEIASIKWEKIGFVEGHGTTNAPKEYSFTDKNIIAGTYSYRLKQIDRDGKFTYSQEVELTFGEVPKVFALEQNYPNPFNPSTTIGFTLEKSGMTTLIIYDAIGREVATLANDFLESGVLHKKQFNASLLASGIYFARLQSGSNIQLRKLVLMK